MPLLGFVHLLLNIAGLLLWLRWREAMFQLVPRAAGGTLLGTLKKAATRPGYRWTWLGLLAGLLLLRAVAYWEVGSALRWTPSIDLGAIVISFRSDLFTRMLIFSVASLVVFVASFYFWLLLISVANQRVSDTDPFQSQVRAHLGWVEGWPVVLKAALPFLATSLLWLGLGPALARLGFILPAPSMKVTAQQAMLIGLASFLVWKYLVASLLLLHLLTSYVYLGHSPFWNFIHFTGGNLLRPIRWVPLRVGRLDFTALAGAALVLFLSELAVRKLPGWYQRLPWW
jgi:uncharacterized protein YggT (Ycf19 family)